MWYFKLVIGFALLHNRIGISMQMVPKNEYQIFHVFIIGPHIYYYLFTLHTYALAYVHMYISIWDLIIYC